MRLNLKEAAAGMGCEAVMPYGQDFAPAPWAGLIPSGAAVDSRLVKAGDIFFCLKGKNADGHAFALDAVSAGACAVVAQHDPFAAREKPAGYDTGLLPVFLTPDVETALMRLAACHRQSASARVAGITGTAGKTSVKDGLFSALEKSGRTERSRGNFNNQVGLPLSLLNAPADARFWVMEAGISRTGDMEALADILRPDLALILNVGDGHLEGLGEGGVAAQKCLLLDYIRPGGTAVVSCDYPELRRECAARGPAFADNNITCRTFSIKDPKAFCFAEYLGAAGPARGRYRVRIAGDEEEMDAPFAGAYGAENAAAVAAAAVCLGIGLAGVKSGLNRALPPPGRFTLEQHGAFALIDDSYNSNPLSAKRMLCAAADVAREAGLPLVLVLGEMLELGAKSASAHERLGELAAAAEPELIFWKGGQEESLRRGLQKGGYGGNMQPLRTGCGSDRAQWDALPPGAVILFKGSRACRLDEAAQSLRVFLADPEGRAKNQSG
ncbi:MAG: UDP-N-acetylmuramoyl-tripeptide--D-alanyl-D-alanine ligase [Desulfovibrio sp.]|jgi:UDP-N-acetylmuramoyl-tripeptide--D-alanyl-D-alanine ligase|nr:UDP-N-acetylmuramoyl-tripeptide--D-alanyl-D-alanine ligase [Desulfovibrio sp.]